jgi:SAM-dependent methyltransferase
VRYREQLEAWFGHLPLEVDDLLLLERFQLLALPSRAPSPALGAVVAADQRLRRFIETRCPELAEWIGELVELADRDTGNLADHRRAVVWELADWLVYQRFPAAYDRVDELRTSAEPFTELCEIEGRTIIDAGAGTGQLSVELARVARAVLAVEPVGRLREYVAQRASDAKLDNVYPLDGSLHQIPLPAASADALVTSRAIGWQIDDELAEVERVVSPGGWAIHLLGTPADGPPPALHEALEAHGYASSRCRDATGWRLRYAKQIV